jgi:origin recognition complex subunit 6
VYASGLGYSQSVSFPGKPDLYGSHVLAGVTTILTPPSPPLSNDGENKRDDKKDKIPALIAAVYFYVRTRLSGRDTSGEEYVSQRKVVLSTLAKLREDEEMIEWEGWEKVGPKDVDAWLLETHKRGWLKLDWFQKIVEGAGLGAPAESDSSDTQPNKSCLVRFPTSQSST